MILFRRDASKHWARLFGSIFPFVMLLLVATLHYFQTPWFVQLMFILGFFLSSAICLRLFIHAEDMFIEVSSDYISWSCPFTKPQSVKAPISDVQELVILDSKSNIQTEPDALIKTTDGHELYIPAITGSIYPILKAIRSAKPDIRESTDYSKNVKQLRDMLRFIVHGPTQK